MPGTIGYFHLLQLGSASMIPPADNKGLLGYKADRSDTNVYVKPGAGLSRLWLMTEEPQRGWAPNHFKCTLFAWDTSRGPTPPGGDWHQYDPWPLCAVGGRPKLTFADDEVPEDCAYWVAEHYSGSTPYDNFIRLTPLTQQGAYLSSGREPEHNLDDDDLPLALNVTESQRVSNRWYLLPAPTPPGGLTSAPRLATA